MFTSISPKGMRHFFLTLAAPECLRPWFAGPGVRADALARELSCSLEELRHWVDDIGTDVIRPGLVLYPCSTSWPMGFSWSSAVAQLVTIAALTDTGFSEDSILSDLHPVPLDSSEIASVCTDDTVFMHTCAEQGRLRLCALDLSFADKGIPRRVDKDESLKDSITALGCHVANYPVRVEPALDKLINFLRVDLRSQ